MRQKLPKFSLKEFTGKGKKKIIITVSISSSLTVREGGWLKHIN